jgi:hypothetical protein
MSLKKQISIGDLARKNEETKKAQAASKGTAKPK